MRTRTKNGKTASRADTLPIFAFLLVLAGCPKKEEPAPPVVDAAPVVAVAAFDAGPRPVRADIVSTSDAGIVPAPASPNEAVRVHATRLSEIPLAGPANSVLRHHYTSMPAGVDLQQAALTARGRTATLVTLTGKPTGDALPLLIVHDERGNVLWSKERPIAGIMAPVGPLALAAGPKGRVALAACDPPTSVVALRLWDDDGSPFADFQAMSIESCDALALLFWPKHGWLIVAARPGATRARLVKESGTPAWAEAIDVGVRSQAELIAAPSVAADTDDTFVLVQVAQPTAAPGSPFHALAFRYDKEGTAIWKQAVDLGETTKGARAVLTSKAAGVRIKLPNRPELELLPSGAFQ